MLVSILPSNNYSTLETELKELPVLNSEKQYTDRMIYQIERILMFCYDSTTINNPIMPIHDFIEAVLKKTRCDWNTIHLALFLIVKSRFSPNFFLIKKDYMEKGKKLPISIRCGRRSFITSLIVATKILMDNPPKNKEWSIVMSLSLKELNIGEREFLHVLDFNTFVSLDRIMLWRSIIHGRDSELINILNILVEQNCPQETELKDENDAFQ
jgi:hypothetical protein